MSDKEAEDYHRVQIETFAGTAGPSDRHHHELHERRSAWREPQNKRTCPCRLLTVETDGGSRRGSPWRRNQQVDDATRAPRLLHDQRALQALDQVVEGDEPWVERIRGLGRTPRV